MNTAVIFLLVLWMADGHVEARAMPMADLDSCLAHVADASDDFDFPGVIARQALCIETNAETEIRS